MKKLKGKLFLPLLLMAFFCTAGVLVKAQKVDMGAFVGEFRRSDNGAELAVEWNESVKKSLEKKAKEYKGFPKNIYRIFNEALESRCFDLAEDYSNIHRFIYDGVTYEVTEDKKEGTLLVITGAEGCSPAPYRGIFPILNIWGKFDFRVVKGEDEDGRTRRIECKGFTEPKIKVDQVIIKGCIKTIPEDFLVPNGSGVPNDNPFRERDGEPAEFYPGLSKVWRVDMSDSDVDIIEFTALHNYGGLREVVLPSHPVKVESAFWAEYEGERRAVSEDKRKTKLIGKEYIVPVVNAYAGDGCCSVQ